jgi:uncharacterized protein (TIGR04222 family)
VAADTWGISGPDFLRLYVIAAVVIAAYSIWTRRRAGRAATGSDRPPRPAELAYLNGGESTVVYSSLAGLRAAGAVAVGSLGELMVTGELPAGATRLDHAIHDAARRHVPGRTLRNDPGVATALRETLDGLIRAGWVLDDEQRTRARLGTWLMVGLAGLGALRLVAGILNDRPVGYLAALIVATLVAALALYFVPRNARTAAGRRLLAKTRRTNRHLRPDQAPAWATYGATGAALGVALYGTAALWAADPVFASDAGLVRPKDSASSAYGGGSGGGCGAAGGSSCGGGGCGGGGCGG